MKYKMIKKIIFIVLFVVVLNTIFCFANSDNKKNINYTSGSWKYNPQMNIWQYIDEKGNVVKDKKIYIDGEEYVFGKDGALLGKDSFLQILSNFLQIFLNLYIIMSYYDVFVPNLIIIYIYADFSAKRNGI